ncbi:Bacterial Ig-like domain [anaerobic digester metagenome]
MNGWTYACLAVGLLFLAAPAGALIPDNVKIITSGEWLTAGSGETATVMVQVTNGTLATPVVGAAVYLAVDDDEYGSISRTYVVTGDDGKATAIFRHGTRSGTATITATVAREGMEPLTDSGEQQIDHATAHKVANLWYDPEVTAGGETNITVRMVDKYGNVVDNRSVAEKVTFTVGQIEGGTGATFNNGWDNITVSVDDAGNATATLQVDTMAGENIVYVTFPGNIGPRSLTITGLANGKPSKIYQFVSPKGEDSDPDYYPEQPLGEQFTITYALYDEYGNPAGDREIRVNVQPISGFLNSEELFTRTNSMGKAQITYTSLDRIGVAEITATAVNNSSVSCTQKVGFYSADPTGIVLTAVPQTIASGDVNGDIFSSIRAKVMDSKGNPVRDQSVSFRITGFDREGNNMTAEPRISNGSSTSKKDDAPLVAMTDGDGFATIKFHPGNFTRDTNPLYNYNDTASGSATIQAEWEGMREDTIVSFRNYPYLSVNVTVEPQVVNVTDNVSVTIRLIGDGWALQKKPIDVMLCTDRSSSMLKDYPDRMVAVMDASRIFNSNFDHGTDQLGLVSFGGKGQTDLTTLRWGLLGHDEGYKDDAGIWRGATYDDEGYRNFHYGPDTYYGEEATVDLNLSSDRSTIDANINKTIPSIGTPMRYGIYRAITKLNETGRSNAVKAVVILGDGEYSRREDPLAEKSDYRYFSDLEADEQNLSVYASKNNIRLYTISFSDDIVENGPTWNTMEVLANATGGEHHHAPTGDKLAEIYTKIARNLQEAAGVDTTMSLTFDPVMIDINDVTTSTNDALEYDPEYPVSTRMVKYWTNDTTNIIWGPVWEDQEQNGSWDGQNLGFEVGDIYLDQTWEASFRLKVLKEGNIDIFGNNSVIHFNGSVGPTELGLPHTFITASHNLSESGAAAAQIWLTQDSLNTDEPGILVPTWGLNYTGNQSVTQKIMYQYSQDDIWWDGNWHEADTLHHPADTNVNGTYSTTLNLGEKEGWYKIRVFAQEITPDDDGASNEITWADSILVGASDRAYIKIS